MPPRHAYWTIIFGNQPTSFRAATRDELLPTFKQIQSRHPDAVMMWFARGRLWQSDEEARAALVAKRNRGARREGPGARREGSGARREGPGARRGEMRGAAPRQRPPDRRGANWRPGGAHKDPRDRFTVPRDVKRRSMAKKFGWKKKDEE